MMDESLFQTELQPGEHIEWTGRPDYRHIFSTIDILLIPFSILWGGFAIFWEISTIVIHAPVLFSLGGMPFVIVGLYLIVGRFFYRRWEKQHTWYAVTNQRIMILTTTFGHKTQSIFLKTLPRIDKSITSNGSGTLIFGTSMPFGLGGNSGWIMGNTGRYVPPAFYDISSVQHVYDLINRLRQTTS